MPSRKYLENETSYSYTLRKQREKYKENPETKAWSQIKYYKKKYKENEEFIKILNTDKKYSEKLLEIKTFNNKKKFD